jgi:hypothetical protein
MKTPSSHSVGAALVVAITLITLKAIATSVSFTPTTDTYISHKVPSPTNGFGSATQIIIGVSGQSETNRGLIQFNVLSIPTNATVTNVWLKVKTVEMSPWFTNLLDDPVGFYPLLVSWNNGANWTNRFTNNTSWSSLGASSPVDYATIPDQVFAFTGPPTPMPRTNIVSSSAGLVSTVQNWVSNPSLNFGWLLKSEIEEQLQSIVKLASKETGSGVTLTVDYAIAPVLTNPMVSESGDHFQFGFNAESNCTYTVWCTGNLTPPDWVSVTNIPAPPAQVFIALDFPLTETNSFYRVSTP